MTNKKALVLASSRGLGLASAKSLCHGGFDVTINGVNDKNLEKSRTDLEASTGANVNILKASIIDDEGLLSILAEIDEKKFDCVVLNSGGPAPGTFMSFEDGAKFIEKTDELLNPTIQILHCAASLMVQKKWGRIINISSIGLQKPIPALAVSNAARAYLHSLMVGMASELGHHNITLNTVCPGIIETDRQISLTQFAADEAGKTYDEVHSEKEKMSALGRMGKPQDIGEMVAFLSSDKASYITGQKFLIDGGVFGGA